MTDRLWLDQPHPDDVEDLHGDRTGEMSKRASVSFRERALGHWSVRGVPGGPIVGCAGCAVPDGLPWWNLYFRFHASVHGYGYAAEVAQHEAGAVANLEWPRRR